MTKTRWIIFAIVCVLALVGIAVLAQREKVDVAGVNPAEVITAEESKYPDHVLGDPSSKVVLIEYGDYQCPFCGSVYQPLKNTVSDYGNSIAFVFRNYPITAIHPNALAAAAAAEAAGLQGKFWEMHDKLYKNQQIWSAAAADQRQSYFDGYAKDLGLNLDQFRSDIISDQVTKRIARDRALASKANVSGTPTFFLNGQKLPDSISTDLQQNNTDSLRAAIDEQIRATGGTPPETSQE